MRIDDFLDRLQGVRRNGTGWTARCPAHEDRNPSLSIHRGHDGRILLKCFAGCEAVDILVALNLELRDLFPESECWEGRVSNPPRNRCNRATADAIGLTVAQYAAAKQLPSDFLHALGVSDIFYMGTPAVRMVYSDADGQPMAIRFRLALEKGEGPDNRFRWRKGDKPTLYGLWSLERARQADYVVLVEGESDCHTLWFHEIPALGVPGANNWNEERDAPHLDGIPTIYVVVEPDQGGQAMRDAISRSRIRDRVWFVELGAHKDASALYLAEPARFREQWDTAIGRAEPWTAAEAEAEQAAREAAWNLCASLACEPCILDALAESLTRSRVVGEQRAAKLLYLVLTTRLLDRPSSAVVKGPSSGGKSYLVERVLERFPANAYYALSAMSERALAYSEEPLVHRTLVIYEAAGMTGDFASYLMRSLLSEGRVRYETVEKTKDGLSSRLIEREGPTGLLVTTTAVHLHPENETRLISIAVSDTPEQTRRVLLALTEEDAEPADLDEWRALQDWLALSDRRVSIPYSRQLAAMVPAVAVRLRRDFAQVLNLIRAHALLHQVTRERDHEGRVVATIEDYTVVRELVADLVAAGVGATVPATVRETVAAVDVLLKDGVDHVTSAQVGRALKLDKSAAYRRVQVAIDGGYLRNLEDKKGRPARLVLGEPLPDDVAILPAADDLAAGLQGCSDSAEDMPPPPSDMPVPEDASNEKRPIIWCADCRDRGIVRPLVTEDERRAFLCLDCQTAWKTGHEARRTEVSA